MIDLVKNYSILSRRVKGSAIRELLKLTNKPDIISFAGGLPSPEKFPVKTIEKIVEKVLKEKAKLALQYTETEGVTELRETLAKYMEKDNIFVKAENILVTCSSQQGLDLTGRVFLDPTDPILVELPTYVGALQAFTAYGAHPIGVKSDDDGMIDEDLEEKLIRLKDSEEHYKFIYAVPDFQNPSGVSWSVERRKKIVDLAEKYNVLIINDAPYRDIKFEGSRLPSLHQLDKNNNVITLCTFSKIFVPGLRLGWVVAHEKIIKKLSIAKQSVDLCTSGLTQLIANEFIKGGYLEDHIKLVATEYKKKRDVMLDALDKFMPKHAGIHWTKPQGGLFLWISLPEHISTDEMFPDAVANNVAYVVGSAFHCNGLGQNTMRLNFSFPTIEQIEEGMKRLAKVVEKRLLKN